MILHITLALLVTAASTFLVTPESALFHDSTLSKSLSYCSQLGCDQKGRFTQDGHEVPQSSKKFVVWHSASPSRVPLNETNENYGCVGTSAIVVCPYHDDANGKPRLVMLNPQTSEEYMSTKYETLTDVGQPVITQDGLVFTMNRTHAILINPIKEVSMIVSLPESDMFPNGFLSPVYLQEHDILVVVGYQSKNIVLLKAAIDYTTGLPELTVLTHFVALKKGNPCPWLTISELAALNNRVYLYGYRSDKIQGVLALDILDKAPYYRTAWELDDQPSNTSGSSSCSSEVAIDNTPSINLATQMVVAPDGYIVVSLPIAILILKDNGKSAKLNTTMTIFGGAHFLSLDYSGHRADNKVAPYLWTSPWPHQQIYSGELIGLDYKQGYNGLRFLTIGQYLNVDDSSFDITSRIMTFPHQNNQSMLVFGASLKVTNTSSVLFTKYCADCKPGVSKIVMGVVASVVSTSSPEILWISLIPGLGYDLEARGQIIGIDDLLIMYVTDGKIGYVMGLK